MEEVIGALSKCLLASGGLDKIREKSLQEDEGKQVGATGARLDGAKKKKDMEKRRKRYEEENFQCMCV